MRLLAAGSLGLLVALTACGDSLVDHRNTGVRDQTQAQPTTCGTNLVQCGTECRSQVVGDPGWVCGTACVPCAGTLPTNASQTCTPVGAGGHDGVCGFVCNPGYLTTAAGCSAPALVAAGGQFSCATAADTGEVHCWGANDQGQLGPGVTGTASATAGKVNFAALTAVTALAAGPAHACAAAGGLVWCWGDATGWGGSASSATPVEVPALAGSTVLVAGARHTCGIAGGTLECAGALADGGGAPALGGSVLELAAGDGFTCALVSGATPSVKCWGANDHGQSSGNGAAGAAVTSPATIPMPAASNAADVLVHVAAGATHACATTNQKNPADPVIFCWGDDTSHQLGKNGTGLSVNGPIKSNMAKLMSTTAPTVIDAGGVTTCAVKTDIGNNLQCWGGDAFAAGTNPSSFIAGELMDLSSLNPPGAFSIGGGHGCIVDSAGRLSCWGRGAAGQLGNSGVADSVPPVLVVDR
jgi:hypothetical protein